MSDDPGTLPEVSATDLIRRVAELLDRPGFSQGGLARALDRSDASVSRMLSGERRIRADELPVIATYLAVDVRDIMPGLEPREETDRRALEATLLAALRKAALALVEVSFNVDPRSPAHMIATRAEAEARTALAKARS